MTGAWPYPAQMIRYDANLTLRSRLPYLGAMRETNCCGKDGPFAELKKC